MSLFGNTILQQVYNTLNGNSALLALVAGVFDHVPQDQAFPYVHIGELSETEFNDDDDQSGVLASLTIHSWSRERGKKETETIRSAIFFALHRASLSASGYNFLTVDYASGSSFMDPDSITRHGVSEFNILIKEA